MRVEPPFGRPFFGDQFTSPPAVVSTQPDDGEGEPVVRLPPNHARLKSFDFSRWLGRGFDELIWACISEIQAMIRAGTPRPTSVCAYCVGGLAYFFEFLSQQSPRISISDVNGDLITAYIHWLSMRGGLTYPSQRNTYTFTKCVLAALTQRGLLPAAETLFPQNPYPQYARRMKGQKPFSLTERERIVKALQADLVAIYANAFDGTEAEALTVHLLALCLRTGLNTTPILELLRDCMQQHPLRDNMRLLVHTKWRAHKIAVAALKRTGISEEHVGINGDGVALVQSFSDGRRL